MSKKKKLLKEFIDRGYKLYEYSGLERVAGGKDKKLLDKLIGTGYIEEIRRPMHAPSRGTFEMTFFRVSEKGYNLFNPWHQRAWGFFTNDIAKILSIIAVIISILVGLSQIGWI